MLLVPEAACKYSPRSVGKESACNVEDLGSIPGLGRSPGKGKGYPLQYSGLENSMDCIVHGVAKSQTGLSDFHFHATLTLFFKLLQLFKDREFVYITYLAVNVFPHLLYFLLLFFI